MRPCAAARVLRSLLRPGRRRRRPSRAVPCRGGGGGDSDYWSGGQSDSERGAAGGRPGRRRFRRGARRLPSQRDVSARPLYEAPDLGAERLTHHGHSAASARRLGLGNSTLQQHAKANSLSQGGKKWVYV